MSSDPIDIAVRNISETRQMLERLITSSESFDYHGAKIALKDLQKRVQTLGKLQAELEARKTRTPNIHVVQFRPQDAASQ